MEVILELIVAIVSAIIQLFYAALVSMFTLFGLSHVSTGWIKVFYALAGIALLYLISVLVLPIFPNFEWILISKLASFGALLTAAAISLFGFFGAVALSFMDDQATPRDLKHAKTSRDISFYIGPRVLAVLVMIILFVIISTGTTTYKRQKTFGEIACDYTKEKVENLLGENRQKLSDLAQRLIKPDLMAKLPCHKDPNQ